MSSKDDANEARRDLEQETDWHPVISSETTLGTSSTTLNLACTGKWYGGYVKGCMHFFVGGSDSGKAQPLDAKILTPTGWSLMGDMEVGQEVADPDGGKGEVVGVYPQGEIDVYEIEFSDGAKTQCCADHLWMVMDLSKRKKGYNVRATKELVDTVHNTAGKPKWRIPVTKPVQFENDVRLPVHPYLMGALLGDGCFRFDCVGFTSCDEEVVNRIRECLPVGGELRDRKRHGQYVVTYKGANRGRKLGTRKPHTVKNALHEFGLMERYSHEKFIPKCYLRASVADRMDLLRGLMDTDGYVQKSKNGIGVALYYTTSLRLAKGVSALVWSLGGVADKRIYREAPTYTHKGEIRKGRRCYSVKIVMPLGMPMFYLKRKRTRNRSKTGLRHAPFRNIASIKHIGKKECQCIRVSTKRNLYITDDYIVTHNSFITTAAFAEAAINQNFDDYVFRHVTAETSMIDIKKFYGEAIAKRIKPMRFRNDEPVFPESLEDFYEWLYDEIQRGRPVLVCLDSQDALRCRVEIEEAKKASVARRGDQKHKEKGSMGAEKAKAHSKHLPGICSELRRTGGIFIIVNQTRDNLGFGSQFNPEIYSGGRALKFYSKLMLWSKPKEKIRGRAMKKDRVFGNLCEIKIKKNHVSGNSDRTVYVPIFRNSGVDDLGACVAFLIDEGHWGKAKAKSDDDDDDNDKGKKGGKGIDYLKIMNSSVDAPEFEFKGKVDALIQKIQQTGKARRLQKIVQRVWDEIEEACTVQRTNKYTQATEKSDDA